jgi:hypothetical protein
MPANLPNGWRRVTTFLSSFQERQNGLLSISKFALHTTHMFGIPRIAPLQEESEVRLIPYWSQQNLVPAHIERFEFGQNDELGLKC